MARLQRYFVYSSSPYHIVWTWDFANGNHWLEADSGKFHAPSTLELEDIEERVTRGVMKEIPPPEWTNTELFVDIGL